MASADSAGIMSGAFFVSKKELLDWVNSFFKLNYTKVEQCASGALHCQILDAIFPGDVPLYKVNFNAKLDYEFVANYKVLQDVFIKRDIKKHVEVERLIKAKYQDNLEFLQWMKHLFDTTYQGQPYDAEARRSEAAAGYRRQHKFAAPAPAPHAAAAPAAGEEGEVEEKKHAKPVVRAVAPVKKAAPTGAASAEAESKIKELTAKVTKLKVALEGLEKERNFYFNKLRDIEVLCQEPSNTPSITTQLVLDIMYKADEAAPAEAAPADASAAPAEEAAPADAPSA